MPDHTPYQPVWEFSDEVFGMIDGQQKRAAETKFGEPCVPGGVAGGKSAFTGVAPGSGRDL